MTASPAAHASPVTHASPVRFDIVALDTPEPGVPQQAHLDLAVDDLATAGEHAESVGARRVHGPGSEQDYWVYLDPAGHPFCLCVTADRGQADGSGEAG